MGSQFLGPGTQDKGWIFIYHKEGGMGLERKGKEYRFSLPNPRYGLGLEQSYGSILTRYEIYSMLFASVYERISMSC